MRNPEDKKLAEEIWHELTNLRFRAPPATVEEITALGHRAGVQGGTSAANSRREAHRAINSLTQAIISRQEADLPWGNAIDGAKEWFCAEE